MGKTHDDDEYEIDLIELLYALKKHLPAILAALIAGAVIAVAYTKLLVTPIYSSTSTMLILTKETTLASLADLQIGSQLTSDYSVLITCRPVLEEVIDNLGLDMEYEDLEENISINNPSDTRILEITVDDPDPELAKSIVDELADVASEFIGDQMEVVPPKIIEEGQVATEKTSPSTVKNTVIGAFIGFVLAAGVVILRVVMDDTVKTEEDVEKYLGIPTLASVPDRKDYLSEKTNSVKKTKKKTKKRRKTKWQSKK